MPYKEILYNCHLSIGGIKDFKIATRDIDGNPLNFPLDVILQSGSTDTLVVQDDFENRILTINNTQIQYRYVYPKRCEFTEEEKEGRQGKLYEKTLTWEMPKVNLTTNNQLKEFLFTTKGESAISNALVFFTDANNQQWMSGFDIPFILENFDLKTGERGGESTYNITYISKSYLRTFAYVVI